MRALIIPLTEAVVGGARRGLVLLMGAIVAVLLIACANLANLSLTRATVRRRDAMIKTALGASVAGVAMLSCAAAAKQGLSIDPAAALREE